MQRFFMIVFGLFIAYFGVYFGEGVSELVSTITLTGSEGTIDVTWIVYLLWLLVFLFGFMFWYNEVNEYDRFERARMEGNVYSALVVFGIGSITYGNVAQPFSQFGYEPWHWMSYWNVLLLLASIPLAFSIYCLCADVLKSLKSRATIPQESCKACKK